MAIQFTSHGKPIPNGNLLIVDGLNLAFRWKHQGNWTLNMIMFEQFNPWQSPITVER